MRSILKLMTTTCLVAATAAPAWAQTAAPAADAPAQANDAGTARVQAEQERREAGVVLPAGSAEPPQADAIVVTGSRIQRPNTTSAAPITSVTATEIQAQAAVNVEDVLNRLPQIAPDSQQNYADSDGRQRIKLRSLGFERTLVLIDGLRLGTQNGQDVGIIPTSLLERVDVLSGGASSVYGSDAVAGVVNFILKKDYEGIQLNANYNFFNHDNKPTVATPVAQSYGFPTTARGLVNDGGRSDITLTVGKRFLEDRLSVSGFVNYRKGSLVTQDTRSTAPCYLQQLTRDGPLTCLLSTYSTSGFVSPAGGPNSGAQYVNDPNGTRSFVSYGPGAGNASNPYDGSSLQRAFERYNAGGFVSLKLSDAAELYGTGIWFRDKSVNPFPTRVYSYTAFGGTPYQVNCNNPYLSASQATAICGAQAGTSALAPLDVRYRFDALPDAPDTYLNSGIRATGGVRGQIGEAWHYDVGGVYARNKQDTTFGPFASYETVNRSLNVVNVNGVPTCAATVSGEDPACVPFDAFSANNNNAALANYLFTGRSGTSTVITSLYDVLANVTGDLGKYGITSPLAKDGVAIALGAEYRKDRFRGTADAVYREQNGGEDANLSQDVVEANIEVQAPLVQEQSWTHLLQVNGGYRISKYSSNPDSFSTWKVEGVWAPIEDVSFRGSINKAQRAPTVIEAYQASNLSYTTTTVQDPCGSARTASIEACRATGLPDNLYGSASLDCPTACTVRNGGYPLVPETAYTKTFGVILKPRFLPGLTVSVDRYLIDLKQSIGYNDITFYINGCTTSADPFYCSGIVRNPGTFTLFSPASANPTTGFFRQGTSNFYKTTAHGWDIQAQYTVRMGAAGRLDWSFNGSRPTITGGQDAPDLLPRDCTGYFGPNCGQSFPKWQHGLRTTYTTQDGGFSASLNWRYIGPLTVTYNSNNPGIGYDQDDVRTTFNHTPAYNYFDLALTFSVEKRFAFRIAANNIFDKTAPIYPNSYDLALSRNNTLPARYDSLGRNIAVGVTTNF